MQPLKEQFGNIDIYLFDQLLKGRFASEMKILDAGCGGGRNLVYFLQNGFQVYGIDKDTGSINHLRSFARSVNANVTDDNFRVAAIDEIPFSDGNFDAVISSAVLHFAEDEAHFRRMLFEMWRVLKPGGLFFARLASSIGIEKLIQSVNERRFLLPDGSTRFLVDEEMLIDLAESLGAELIDPIKTTNVQNLRAMTTWVLRKKSK